MPYGATPWRQPTVKAATTAVSSTSAAASPTQQTTTAPVRTVNRPSTWEGFNASTPQGGHSEADILAAAMAYGAPRGLEPVYLKDNGQYLNGGYQIKFRDTKLGGVSTTEFVPMDGYSGYTMGGGGGGGGGGIAGGGIPGEGIYQEQQALANRAYQDAINNINFKKNQTYRTYGFTPEGTADPNNQLGLYQRMRGEHAGQLMDANEARVGRGLSATGLGAQQTTRLRGDQEFDTAQMMREYQNSLHGLDQERLGAERALQEAILQARLAQLMAALASRDWNSGSVSSGDGGSTAAEATAAAEEWNPPAVRAISGPAGNSGSKKKVGGGWHITD
jgi:hypothetical protein